MTHGECVVYPLRRAVRGLLALHTIGQQDRLSLETINADAGRLAEVYAEVYGECPHPDFGVTRLVTAADALYARAQTIAAKYGRRD